MIHTLMTITPLGESLVNEVFFSAIQKHNSGQFLIDVPYINGYAKTLGDDLHGVPKVSIMQETLAHSIVLHVSEYGKPISRIEIIPVP